MKRTFSLITLGILLSAQYRSQSGYDIRINFKGCKDTNVYLARYFFDRVPVVDSCKNIKNGKIEFKGKTPLEKGVYMLANQAKNSYYFQFIVDDNQKFTISLENTDINKTLKSEDKLNEQFFSYVRFMSEMNKTMQATAESTK